MINVLEPIHPDSLINLSCYFSGGQSTTDVLLQRESATAKHQLYEVFCPTKTKRATLRPSLLARHTVSGTASDPTVQSPHRHRSLGIKNQEAKNCPRKAVQNGLMAEELQIQCYAQLGLHRLDFPLA